MAKEIKHDESKLIIMPDGAGNLVCRGDYTVTCTDCGRETVGSTKDVVLPAAWKTTILQYYNEEIVPEINAQEGI